MAELTKNIVNFITTQTIPVMWPTQNDAAVTVVIVDENVPIIELFSSDLHATETIFHREELDTTVRPWHVLAAHTFTLKTDATFGQNTIETLRGIFGKPVHEVLFVEYTPPEELNPDTKVNNVGFLVSRDDVRPEYWVLTPSA